ALNLLPEIEGTLPRDKPRLLAVLDEFLALPAVERALFALGARLGIYRRLADRHDGQRRALLYAHVPGLEDAEERELLAAAAAIRSRFI
ncbi:MAG: radical SAM protein, partial [Actinobacteria bacterium]|nr:radical SAM protein [Actinomycetota bacterium]